MSKGNEVRFNLGLRGQTADLVTTLVERGYKPKDVVFDALTILDFAIQEIAAGKHFGSVDPDNKTLTTVATPILQAVRKNPDWLNAYLGHYAEESEKKVAAAEG